MFLFKFIKKRQKKIEQDIQVQLKSCEEQFETENVKALEELQEKQVIFFSSIYRIHYIL